MTGIDAGKHDMTAVVLTGPDAVHGLVIVSRQLLPPFRVPPNPGLELVTESLLLLRRQGRFFAVQDTPLFPVRVLDCIVDAYVPEIQRILQDVIGVGPVGSVGRISGDIIMGDSEFLRHLPFACMLGIQDPDCIPQAFGSI